MRMHVWLSQRAIGDWASTGMVVNPDRGRLNTKIVIFLFMLGRAVLKYRKDTYRSVFSGTFYVTRRTVTYSDIS